MRTITITHQLDLGSGQKISLATEVILDDEADPHEAGKLAFTALELVRSGMVEAAEEAGG